MGFPERLRSLPVLGLGPSTEYGAPDVPGSLDPFALRTSHAGYAAFLEVGVEIAKGLDEHARQWAARGLPTTYHFLDVNLDEPVDLDDRWLDQVREVAEVLQPAWLCGDAGLWHLGPRGRGHMLLLPPILTRDSARAMAEGIARLRDSTGLEVLPENPPGVAFVGDLHLLDFFALLAEEADTGILLDAAHLAIYQRVTGREPLDGLDGFPLDRVVEVHVAGGTEAGAGGFPWVEDDHGPRVLPDTWAILEAVAARATELRAVVHECERNPLEATLPGFARIAETLAAAAGPIAPLGRP